MTPLPPCQPPPKQHETGQNVPTKRAGDLFVGNDSVRQVSIAEHDTGRGEEGGMCAWRWEFAFLLLFAAVLENYSCFTEGDVWGGRGGAAGILSKLMWAECLVAHVHACMHELVSWIEWH